MNQINQIKNTIRKQKYNFQDKNWINKFLRLFLYCIGTTAGSYLFDFKNFDTSDFVLAIFFGITIWIMLIVQKKI